MPGNPNQGQALPQQTTVAYHRKIKAGGELIQDQPTPIGGDYKMPDFNQTFKDSFQGISHNVEAQKNKDPNGKTVEFTGKDWCGCTQATLSFF